MASYMWNMEIERDRERREREKGETEQMLGNE